MANEFRHFNYRVCSTDLDLCYIYDHMGYLGFSATSPSAHLQNPNYLKELTAEGIVRVAVLDNFGNLEERRFLNGFDMSSPSRN